MAALLATLEAESLAILRETAAGVERAVLLYSIGKDSTVLLHLARKAFAPAPLPFPLLHVDTGWKFRAMYVERDRVASLPEVRLIVHRNPEAQALGINPFDHGPRHTDMWKTAGLRQALDAHGFEAAIGGARRDEEPARAKERVVSVRGPGHGWDPRAQRPEIGEALTFGRRPGETLRVFPLSHWTERDIWAYIAAERLPVVPLYFAEPRPVVEREGRLIVVDDEARMRWRAGERAGLRRVRFRSLGCWPLSGAVESSAGTLDDILTELAPGAPSERQGRLIDREDGRSMERRKREGYF